MVAPTALHVYLQNLISDGSRSQNLANEIVRISNRCNANDVLPIYTLHHLASRIGLPFTLIRDCMLNPRKYYSEHKISKRRPGAGHRLISVPSTEMRTIQEYILRKALPTRLSTPLSFAFEKDRSVSRAARVHIGAKAALLIDLKNFYGSINDSHVYQIFANLGYAELFAFELSQLTTYGASTIVRPDDRSGMIYKPTGSRSLPQGASTSGKLANLRCSALDSQLADIVSNHGGQVTRYADDIAVSFPTPRSRDFLWSVHQQVEELFADSGFALNKSKTRILRNVESFRMLGLLVGPNDIALLRGYKRHLRYHLYGIEKFGIDNHAAHVNCDGPLGLAEKLWGHFAYAFEIEPKFAIEYADQLKRLRVERF